MEAEPKAVNPQDAFEAQHQLLREKILFGLSIYPALNPSMLHVFVGTAQSKDIWKEVVLEELLAEGLVIQETVTLRSPNNRTQTYTILRLHDTKYNAPSDPDSEEDLAVVV